MEFKNLIRETQQFLKQVLSLLFPKRPHYQRLRILPSFSLLNKIKDNEIVIIGSIDKPKWAVLLCPCGCKNTLKVNLMKSYEPYWEIKVEKKNLVTLYPSLWLKEDCYSHFFIKSGKVTWV